MMNPYRSCFLFCLCYGYLIAGVSHEKAISVLSKEERVQLNPGTHRSEIEQHSEGFFNEELQTLKYSISRNSSNLCSSYDSCFSRCGKVSLGFSHTCNCDSQCSYYGDCCLDFQAECKLNDTKVQNYANPRTKPKCQILFETFPIYAVSDCSKDWKNSSYEKLCHTNLPGRCLLPELFPGNQSCDSIYYLRCWTRLSALCNENVDSQCNKLVEDECKRLTAAVCKNCRKTLRPAMGADGLLYKNSYCAECNFQNNYTIPSLKYFITVFRTLDRVSEGNNSQLRRCFDTMVKECPSDSDPTLSALCAKISRPVMNTVKPEIQRKTYKNVYCAKCYNEPVQELKCVSASIFKSTNFRILTNNRERFKVDDIPNAFSMLLNFGLDGRQRVNISSEDGYSMRKYQERCENGFIWNPFSNTCRKLHCSTEFVLVDYQCVKKDVPDETTPPGNDTAVIPDVKSNFIHLTLTAEIELIDFLQFNGQEDIDKIAETIRESFSNSLNVSLDRIRNVRFNISLGNFKTKKQTLHFLKQINDESHPITFIIDLDLYESDYGNVTEREPSVDSIVSMLASAVSTNGFEFGINNATGRIFEMQKTLDHLKDWCNPDEGGQKKEYLNSEFKLILSDDDSLSAGGKVKGIYINKTGKFYPKGQFIADILYQAFQPNQNLVNVSGLAIVCDWKKKLKESCVRIILEKHEYSILENGSLVLNTTFNDEVIDHSAYEKGENGSILVCFSDPPGSLRKKYQMQIDFTQAYVSYILSCISIAAMIMVLITYFIFPSLRNLPGCNTMNLTFSLLVMQITYIFGQRPTVIGSACKYVAIILHYEILCCFMWMNIMAYDLFKTFGTKTVLNNIRSKGKYLPRYILYAYGTPILVVLTTFLLDYFLDESEFSPQYGRHNVCWITSRIAAIAYFATPLAIIMCVNLIFYILTIHSIRSVKSILHLSHQKTNHSGKNDVFLYARMAFVIGLTWALAFAAAYVKEEKLVGKILTYLFIIFNTLQGVFIFCVFVCNRRVLSLYKGALIKLAQYVVKNSKGGKSSKTLVRLANVMHRSVSSDTVISTISNSSTCSNDSGLKTIKEK